MHRLLFIGVVAMALVAVPVAPRPASAEAGNVGLSIGDAHTHEGDVGTHEVSFPVRLGVPVATTVRVDYRTVPGTATSPREFRATSGTLTLAPGTTSGAVRVAIVDDLYEDPDVVAFTVVLSNAVGAALDDKVGAGTIAEDDDEHEIRASNVWVTEGDAGKQVVSIPLTLRSPAREPLQFSYRTTSQPHPIIASTAVPGHDYTATSGTVTFAPGEVSKSVAVTVFGDRDMDRGSYVPGSGTVPHEEFWLDVGGVGRPASAQAEVTIYENDPAPIGGVVEPPLLLPSVTIGDVDIEEGDAGTRFAALTVRLNVKPATEVLVGFRTGNGTATPGSDYTPVSGTLRFAPGQAWATVTVPVHGDLAVDGGGAGPEIVPVELTNAVGATVDDGAAQVVIIDGDRLPSLIVTEVLVPEGDVGDQRLELDLSLSSPLDVAVGFEYRAREERELTYDSARDGTDFEQRTGALAISAGAATTPAKVTVTLKADTVQERREHFELFVSGKPAGMPAISTTRRVAIRDN